MPGALGGTSRRVLLVGVAVLLAFAAGGLFPANAAAPGVSARRLLLRLHDLPLGYSGNFASIETGHLDECGYLQPAEAQSKLKAFIDEYSPKGCLAPYIRLYKVRGSMPAPPLVGTAAMDLGSVEGAEAGIAVAPEAIGYLLSEDVDQVEGPPAETIGDTTRLLHWKDVCNLYDESCVSGSFLVWRSGAVLAVVFVAGFRAKADDRIAMMLAHRQQAHIEHPTPYTLAERDSTEVPLDNPSLVTPVYWLRKRFAERQGLPALRLFDTSSYTGHSLRAPRVNLLYVDHPPVNHSEGVNLNLWSSRQWRDREADPGKLPGSLRCGKQIRQIELPHGHAVIFRGVQGRHGHCRDRRRHIFTARVHFRRVILTAETMSICATCFGAGTGPYDSLRGMKAVVRGLAPRLRPAPTPPETP